MAELPPLRFATGATPSVDNASTVRVDDTRTYQPIWGVGATLTNSASFLLNEQLTPNARTATVWALFSSWGAHLSWVGVTLGGSDFNAWGRRYSEDDMPPGDTDPWLRHFSLRHDRDTIALLRVARRLNPHLRIFARSWSAPGWMKTNDRLDDDHYSGSLLARYYAVYAQYFVKYLRGMARAGVPIYAITVQNEPVDVPASYEGMYWPAPQEASFIGRYLRPALRAARLATKIYATDESWDQASYAALENDDAGGLDGMSWHCYAGNPDTVMPRFGYMPQALTECSPSLIRAPVGALLTNVLNDGASAAGLWNIALNPSGGPVVSPDTGCRGCEGLLTVDPQTHTVHANGGLYQLAQFGHFLEPGARRIAATRLGHFVENALSDRATVGLHDVAVDNPDGTDVLVLYNNSRQLRLVRVLWRGMVTLTSVPAGATTTLRWRQ